MQHDITFGGYRFRVNRNASRPGALVAVKSDDLHPVTGDDLDQMIQEICKRIPPQKQWGTYRKYRIYKSKDAWSKPYQVVDSRGTMIGYFDHLNDAIEYIDDDYWELEQRHSE